MMKRVINLMVVAVLLVVPCLYLFTEDAAAASGLTYSGNYIYNEEAPRGDYSDTLGKPPVKEDTRQYIGTFDATAYCGCATCCGEADQPTKSGTIPEQGRTCGVDENIIPLGSTVILEFSDGSTMELIAEDTGGFSGYVIDVFIEDHDEAWSFGRHSVKVYIEKRD